jgi:hypothetical protein
VGLFPTLSHAGVGKCCSAQAATRVKQQQTSKSNA